MKDEIKEIKRLNEENEDYKSRCEKAINYIEASKINRYVYALDFNTLLNILRGDE